MQIKISELTPGSAAPNSVVPASNEAGTATEKITLDAISRLALGDVTFSGVQVIGSGEGSGDGLNKGTLELVPDSTLYVNHQYLVIDPTGPDHIHLRAGGTQDASNAELILGGEHAHVRVADSGHEVSVKTDGGLHDTTVEIFGNGNCGSGLQLNFNPPIGSVVTRDGIQHTVVYVDTSSDCAHVDFDPYLPFNGPETLPIHLASIPHEWTFNSNGALQFPGGLSISATQTKLGINSTASGFAPTVGGGSANSATGSGYSTVAGGNGNQASGYSATVCGGSGNSANANGAFVGGGRYNTANADASTVSGGQYNTAGGPRSAVGGGKSNSASGTYSTVSGGYSNNATGYASVVAGGYNNTAIGSGPHNIANFVGGGKGNTANGKCSVVSGGYSNNTNQWYCFVGGGGFNTASAAYSAVTSGFNNTASGYASIVGGGSQNTSSGYYSAVGGGSQNTASGDKSAVGGGRSNTASGSYSTVGGGFQNYATASYSCVVGGCTNTASGSYTFIGSGQSNSASGKYSFVGGGKNNTSSAYASTVTGGRNNTASNYYSIVGGGKYNTASGYIGTVAGGLNNTASSNYSTVGGGYGNNASGWSSTVGGGKGNTASSDYSAVGGGKYNSASAYLSVVGGGRYNTASGYASTVGGGDLNTASADSSVVGGGRHNTASGNFSAVGGGIGAIANQHGMQAYSAGYFSAQGDAQSVKFILRGSTGSSYNGELFLDGSSTRLTVPANTAFLIDASFAFFSGQSQNCAYMKRRFILKNVNGTTSIQGAIQAIGTDQQPSSYIVSYLNISVFSPSQLQVDYATNDESDVRCVAVLEGIQIGLPS